MYMLYMYVQYHNFCLEQRQSNFPSTLVVRLPSAKLTLIKMFSIKCQTIVAVALLLGRACYFSEAQQLRGILEPDAELDNYDAALLESFGAPETDMAVEEKKRALRYSDASMDHGYYSGYSGSGKRCPSL